MFWELSKVFLSTKHPAVSVNNSLATANFFHNSTVFSFNYNTFFLLMIFVWILAKFRKKRWESWNTSKYWVIQMLYWNNSSSILLYVPGLELLSNINIFHAASVFLYPLFSFFLYISYLTSNHSIPPHQNKAL